MKKSITTIPFEASPEQEKKLSEAIERNRAREGALMPILQEAQKIFGYLPLKVQMTISEALDVPLEEIYGIATFYSQFTLAPKGEYDISVCLGTACYVRGIGAVLNRLQERLGIGAEETTPDGKFSISTCRCIGCCGLAPVITVNGEVYGRLVADDVDAILDKYMNGGENYSLARAEGE